MSEPLSGVPPSPPVPPGGDGSGRRGERRRRRSKRRSDGSSADRIELSEAGSEEIREAPEPTAERGDGAPSPQQAEESPDDAPRDPRGTRLDIRA